MDKMQPAIEITNQGKIVIEPDGDGFLIMFPDGSIEGSSKTNAERKARRWFKTKLGKGLKIGIGEIEWR